MGTGQREEEDGDRSNIDARFCSYARARSLIFDLSLVSLPAKENYRPKHRAISELGRRQVSVRLEKIFPSLDRNGASMAQPSV